MPDKRYRIQHRFWLDGTKPREDNLSIRLDGLKQNREFANFMRQAVNLLFSLRDGDLSLFAEMFPDAVEVLKQDGAEEERQKSQYQLTSRIDELKGMIGTLETLKLAAGGLNMKGAKSLGAGPKPLGSPAVATPKFDDDDDDLIQIQKDTSTDAGLNFLKSALALQQ